MKCDGTHTTLKPSQMSVARITVVRGYVIVFIKVLVASWHCFCSKFCIHVNETFIKGIACQHV